jgi:hypothetical protein
MIRLVPLLLLTVVLYACPYESKVPLDIHPAEAVDTTLLGYWYGIIKDGSDYFGIEALEISKESDSVYSIVRYGKAIKGDIILPDTAYFTGYVSYIGEQRFMNIQGSVVITTTRGKKPPIIQVEKVFYLSSIKRAHDTLSVKTVTEQFTASRKTLNTPELLKTEISEQLGRNKNVFDDIYSLYYRKIQKPKPLKSF